MKLGKNTNLYKIRHSLAHVLAQAVQKIYPDVKLGFGPPTDIGFFYDFDLGEKSITPADLKNIEKQMKKIIAQKQEFSMSEINAEGATKKMSAVKETFKVENVQNLSKKGVERFTFFENGPFVDLCEGPHVANTSELPMKAFKLDRISGAYWLGKETNPSLTRIYGIAFETPEELQSYLERRRIAEKFDHKKLGKELDIYHIDDLVGKGLPLWLPNGTIIRDEIEKFAREKEFRYGYKRVSTPHISKEDLYLKSQHLPAYKDSMFPPMKLDEGEDSSRYYLKAMNCPHHHLIFSSRKHSYRDLPLRLAEYGTCYRFEKSGELSGLIRVRCMTMNDAHLYIRPEQFEEEFKNTMNMYMEFYETFKLSEYSFRLSIRGKENTHKFKGEPAMWDKAEALLAKVMDDMGLKYEIGEGEGAFYGPKLDIQFKNLMGREETVSTIQVDLLSSENFELEFTDENGENIRPIILHRAPLSTHERFISFLIEYYGGAFPTWCAPIQVGILPVIETCHAYAQELADEMAVNFIRTDIDDSDNSFNKKIRTNTMKKIPILLIIGENEKEKGTVTIRRYGEEEQVEISKEEFMDVLQEEIKTRKMRREPMGSII